MKDVQHPILNNLAFLTRIIESELSDQLSVKIAFQEREKIIVQCCLN